MNTLSDYQQIAYHSVDKLFRDIEHLKQSGHYIEQERKQLFQKKLNNLQEKKEIVRQRYNQLSTASAETSEELKNGFEKAKKLLTSAWIEAKEEFVS